MKEFLLSIISGVSAAISFAVIVWIFTGFKDLRLKCTIKSSIAKSISYFEEAISGIGIVLCNNTHVDIIIRSVNMILIATTEHPDLKEGEKSGYYKLQYHGPSEFGSLKGGKDQEDARKFIKMPAYTGGRWIVPLLAFKGNPFLRYSFFDDCEVELEYPTLNKNPKIIKVKIKGKEHASAMIYTMEKMRQKFITEGIDSFLPPFGKNKIQDDTKQ